MLQIRRHANLAEESLGAEHCAELGVEKLEGDEALMLDVAREIDRRHPAAAELSLDAITICKCRENVGRDGRHGRGGGGNTNLCRLA